MLIFVVKNGGWAFISIFTVPLSSGPVDQLQFNPYIHPVSGISPIVSTDWKANPAQPRPVFN